MPRVPAKKRGQKKAAKRSAPKAPPAKRTSSNGDQSGKRALQKTIPHFNNLEDDEFVFFDEDFDWLGVVEASKKDKNPQLLAGRK